jgi:death-on-curing protein
VKRWAWIEPPVVLALHEEHLAEHGGRPGVRDEGLLASALARPRNKTAYDPESDAAALAAAYAFGIARDHPFIDGNKRTAFVAAKLFLDLNGFELTTGEVENLPLEHPDPSQLQRLVDERTSQQVRAALAKLPARARMALVLRYYAEMSYDEIADSLGVRRPFVGVVLLRARHQLREVLGQPGSAGLAARGAS